MADTITFTSAVLEKFSRNGSGGKATFACGLNQKVMQAMGWVEIPECLTGANLEGSLSATTVKLVPSESQLKDHQIELSVSQVSKFESVRLEIEGKKGKGHRTELRFVVAFPDTKGARKLEQYMLTIGEGKSSLTVSYVKQEVIPGMEATDEQRQATMEAED